MPKRAWWNSSWTCWAAILPLNEGLRLILGKEGLLTEFEQAGLYDFDGLIDLIGGGEAPEAETNGSEGFFVGDFHGLQDVGRFHDG